jgi:hypothetical protein
MDGKRKILIFIFFLFASIAYGQSISYTYVDPCTGIANTVTVSSQSGTVVMFYAGNYQTFTMAQLQSGGYEAWVAQVNAAAPPGSNPCAGNAGAVAGSTSASVGTNVTNTVTNITGALSVLGGGNLTSSSGGMSTGGGSVGGSSSSDNSSSSGNDQGNESSSSDSGGGSSSDGSNSSGQSSSNDSGSSTGGSSSGSTDGGTGGSSGSGSSSSGSTDGGSGGSGSGSSGGGGSTGGSTGGSSGGGSTSGGGTSSNTEGSGGVDGTGSATSGGGDDSNSGGAVGDKSIEASSGGQSDSESESDSGGSGGGKKKKGPRARKGSLIASGDMVVIRNGSDYKQGGNDNFKLNMGMTYANTDQTLAAGALLNYTTGQNEVALTGYGSWKIEQSMIVASNSFLYNAEQKTWFNTGNVMYAYKQTSYMTVLYGTNFSIGRLGEENFNNWSAQVGAFTTLNGYKGVAVNLMGIGMYSPYTFFYEGQWFKGGFLLVPLTSVDMAVTDTFKLNISTSTVMLQGEGILNFQLMTGGKMLL